MFIKIKLESISEISEETNSKTPSYIEVGDESTVGEIKRLIERNIDVPAERQVIRTALQILTDDQVLAETDAVNGRDGSSVMVYITDAGAGEENGTFLCFLQFYSADGAAIQQDYEKRSTDLSNCNPPSVTSTITLVEDGEAQHINAFLDSNSSQANSESSTESDSETDFDSESANSADGTTTHRQLEEGRKRRLDVELTEIRQNKIRRRTVIHKIPSSLSTYLDGFPNYSSDAKGVSAEMISNSIQLQSEAPLAPNSVECSSTLPNTIDPKQIKGTQLETSSPSTTIQDPEPWATIPPEQRAFIVIVSSTNRDKQIDAKECVELLASFFDIFKASDNIENLKFHDKAEFVLYNGLLWLACQDEHTFAWTLAKSNSLSDTHESHKFTDHFKLKKCLTVIPRVDRAKNLLDAFSVIEQQNSGINTAQWTVLGRRLVLNDENDFFKKSVCRLCPNEVLFLRVDQKTLDSLQKLNFKLNYCFWQITFEVNEFDDFN